MLEFYLTPAGGLYGAVDPASPAAGLTATREATIAAAFARGAGPGLLELGSREVSTPLHGTLAYWRDFAKLYLTRLSGAPDIEEHRGSQRLPPPEDRLRGMLLAAPPMRGGEYLTFEVLADLWEVLHAACRQELVAFTGKVEDFLRERSPLWNVLGRVHFHLAEQKRDPEHPFAFIATYTRQVDAAKGVKHVPLGQALIEYAGEGDRAALLSLLKAVHRASETSSWLAGLVKSGAVHRTLLWTPAEAYQFLKEVPHFEAAGIVVRVPDWWRSSAPSRPTVRVTVGDRAPSGIGLEALLSFKVEAALGGERLTASELRELMREQSSLVLLKGRWVEFDRERFGQVLDYWKDVEEESGSGIEFLRAMRLLAGGSPEPGVIDGLEDVSTWSERVAGPWLERILGELGDPTVARAPDLGSEFRATLRPYQEAGLSWLWTLSRLGLGGLLADDMGLGKTVQVIALLTALKRKRPGSPHLLVVPASVLHNWVREIERFSPGLRVWAGHPALDPEASRNRKGAPDLSATDVVLTSHGYLGRLEWLDSRSWDVLIVDEAQAIKNPKTAVARRLRTMRSRVRIALTGTPVENRLGDLWALFDFINPGLLGSAADFTRSSRRMEERGGYEPLRRLIRPYLLRRLKTDRRIIADLPDKTEMLVECPLSKQQIALYETAVRQLAREISTREGIDRRGLIFAYMVRFKQILNHPSQWLGDADFDPAHSGKFQRLQEILGEVSDRLEKALVFTQFREMTEPLARFLAGVFGREGLVLHGETSVKKRREIVDRFQQDDTVPFLVLSLKAGGTGLNLTAANHVVHFDRWWNPAVEEQATDRAFRIGQKKNVLVHKLLCPGTLEEKIQKMLEDKQMLSRDLLEGGGELSLTELSDKELLKLVSLDLREIMQDS